MSCTPKLDLSYPARQRRIQEVDARMSASNLTGEARISARRQIEAVARANFAAQTQTHVATLDLLEARSHSDLARRLDAAAQTRDEVVIAAVYPLEALLRGLKTE